MIAYVDLGEVIKNNNEEGLEKFLQDGGDIILYARKYGTNVKEWVKWCEDRHIPIYGIYLPAIIFGSRRR